MQTIIYARTAESLELTTHNPVKSMHQSNMLSKQKVNSGPLFQGTIYLLLSYLLLCYNKQRSKLKVLYL